MSFYEVIVQVQTREVWLVKADSRFEAEEEYSTGERVVSESLDAEVIQVSEENP